MLSRPESIPTILYALDDWVARRLRQGRILALDVGPGWGKWGLMLREIVASHMAEAGDMTPPVGVKLHLTAMEMCAYFTSQPALNCIYDQVIRADARQYEHFDLFDLILCFDVLEHWTLGEIQGFFNKIFHEAAPHVLVSIPKQVCMYSQPYYGKDCPKHKVELTPSNYRVLLPDRHVEELPCPGNWVFWVR